MSQAARSNPLGAPASPSAPAGLRVVLVGRTGLDQSLRREAGLEIYRARNSFEAVGELGTPLGPESPGDAVVIVAPGTVTQDELGRMSAALRRVDPTVCVVGLLESASSRSLAPDPAAFGLDAWLAPPVSAGVLRLLVMNRGTPDARSPAVDHKGGVESTHAPAVTPPATAPWTRGHSAPPSSQITRPGPAREDPAQPTPALPLSTDLAPLHALLAAGDVVTACLSVLRARARDEGGGGGGGGGGDGEDQGNGLGERLADWAFVPAGSLQAAKRPGEAPPEPLRDDRQEEPRAAVPVVHKGHTFGTLFAARAAGPQLREAADWLAAWLALREQQSQLRRAAFTDPLTGAWNRRYFDGFLARALAEARASRHDVSLLLFDIDDFKQYNDRFGHAAGDEILVEVVRLLKSVVRAGDRVCRLGGDEFAVIFHEPSGPREAGSHHPASILELARRFEKHMAQARFRKLGDDARANLGVSGGLATYPWDGHDAESLIEHADRLLCESKSKGKNVIRLGPGVGGPRGPG